MTKTFVEYDDGPVYSEKYEMFAEDALTLISSIDDVSEFEVELCNIKKVGYDLNADHIVDGITWPFLLVHTLREMCYRRPTGN